MKWTKLEYGQWPKGEIVMRLDIDKDDVQYEVGNIRINAIDKEYYFYCALGFPSKHSVDSIYDLGPHYISLDAIEMPEVENEQP